MPQTDRLLTSFVLLEGVVRGILFHDSLSKSRATMSLHFRYRYERHIFPVPRQLQFSLSLVNPWAPFSNISYSYSLDVPVGASHFRQSVRLED